MRDCHGHQSALCNNNTKTAAKCFPPVFNHSINCRENNILDKAQGSEWEGKEPLLPTPGDLSRELTFVGLSTPRIRSYCLVIHQPTLVDEVGSSLKNANSMVV